MTWLTFMEYLCHKQPRIFPLVVKTSQSFPHSWLITGFVTRLTRRVPLVAQELLTIAEHPSSPQVFSGVRVTRSLVLCVCFVERCLSFCTFSFGHCVVCSSSIYGFWLLFWYLQTPLSELLSFTLGINCVHILYTLFTFRSNEKSYLSSGVSRIVPLWTNLQYNKNT